MLSFFFLGLPFLCGPKTKGSVINLKTPVIRSQCVCILLWTQEDIIAVSCVGLPATQPGSAGIWPQRKASRKHGKVGLNTDGCSPGRRRAAGSSGRHGCVSRKPRQDCLHRVCHCPGDEATASLSRWTAAKSGDSLSLRGVPKRPETACVLVWPHGPGAGGPCPLSLSRRDTDF